LGVGQWAERRMGIMVRRRPRAAAVRWIAKKFFVLRAQKNARA